VSFFPRLMRIVVNYQAGRADNTNITGLKISVAGIELLSGRSYIWGRIGFA
jgi:hypothetical protein